MSLLRELKTAGQIVFAPVRGDSHAERLESFYRRQKEGYDEFREKLLHGRRELFEAAVGNRFGGVWVDIGAGTGRNLEFVSNSVPQFDAVHLVDLSPSLLEIAQQRVMRAGWKNVHCHHADASTFKIAGRVDLVTFSYSLSMIPDWFRAVENAVRMLAPGGRLACVDFFVSRKHPEAGRAHHGWWTRTLWPTWFAFDGVHLSSEVPRYLQWKLETEMLEESSARVPYIPVGKVPFYRFIGKKLG